MSCCVWLGACSQDRDQAEGVTGVVGAAGVPAAETVSAGSAAPFAGRGTRVGVAGSEPLAAGGGAAGSGSLPAVGSGTLPMAGAGILPIGGMAGADQAVAGSSGAAGRTQAGAGGAAGADPSSTHPGCSMWPAPNGEQQVSATIQVMGRFDGKLKRYVGSGALGSSGQDEGQDPMFELADGATLENVVIGAPAADGIHCRGNCTLRNVWWQDVGEDAATLMGSAASQTMTVECGGAKGASDKVFQHNGPGKMIVRNFDVQDFGKLYRSCGNCKTQFERHVELSMITAKGGKVLVGINSNYNDTASLKDIVVVDPAKKLSICERFRGNNTGDEPSKEGSGPDAKSCLYSDSDIHWQ
jgi:hypothetical protein